MPRLTFTATDSKGQRLEVSATLNEYGATPESIEAWIRTGSIALDITELLNDAEGNPLATIVESIDWDSLLADYENVDERQDKVDYTMNLN